MKMYYFFLSKSLKQLPEGTFEFRIHVFHSSIGYNQELR
jgi:hypothetical protein